MTTPTEYVVARKVLLDTLDLLLPHLSSLILVGAQGVYEDWTHNDRWGGQQLRHARCWHALAVKDTTGGFVGPALSEPYGRRAGALKVRLLGDALCLPRLRSLISTGIAVILQTLRVSVLGALRPRRHLRDRHVTGPIRCTYTRTVRSWIRHRIRPSATV
jgi:hypothetical protein